ncbi:MAG: hypothetical protein Q9194_001459 [Teloschistes cf. exilis]
MTESSSASPRHDNIIRPDANTQVIYDPQFNPRFDPREDMGLEESQSIESDQEILELPALLQTQEASLDDAQVVLDLRLGHEPCVRRQPAGPDSAYAMVIYLWLLVSKKRGQGIAPVKGEYLHLRWGAYFLSALKLFRAEIRAVKTDQVSFAIRHYEDRSFRTHGLWFWTSNSWWMTMQLDDLESSYERNDEATEYLEVLNTYDIEDLVEFLVRREVELQKSALRVLPSDEVFRWQVLIMASIDPNLLKAIIKGQVPRLAQIPSSAIFARLKGMMNDDDASPLVYQNAVCDQEGISPTPLQRRKVCELMQQYVSLDAIGNGLAKQVDQIKYPSKTWPIPRNPKERLLRRYAEMAYSYQDCPPPCSERRAVIWDFTVQLLERIRKETVQGREHTPLIAPLVQIGFSNSPYIRLQEHLTHQKSTYIMNLADSLLEYLHPGMLAQGYTTNGGGFSHYGAGRSNASKRSMQQWAQWSRRAWEDEKFRDRVNALPIRSAARALAKQEQNEREAHQIAYLRAAIDMVEAAMQLARAEREL